MCMYVCYNTIVIMWNIYTIYIYIENKIVNRNKNICVQ